MISVAAFFDELEKIAINLQQLTRLEQLAGPDTVRDIMGSIERSSGAMGPQHVPRSHPMTAHIVGGKMVKVPLGAPAPVAAQAAPVVKATVQKPGLLARAGEALKAPFARKGSWLTRAVRVAT